MAKQTVSQKPEAAAAALTAKPFPIAFPIGASWVFQVSPTAPYKDRQDVASCILSTVHDLAEFMGHQDEEEFEARNLGWVLAYLTAFAKGLLDSMKLEDETA